MRMWSSGGGGGPGAANVVNTAAIGDYQHGSVEKYDKVGHHLGEYDADTGEQTKPPTNRRVEP